MLSFQKRKKGYMFFDSALIKKSFRWGYSLVGRVQHAWELEKKKEQGRRGTGPGKSWGIKKLSISLFRNVPMQKARY